MDDVERLCFTFELRPGSEAEYRRRHAVVWAEVTKAIKEAGISNYSLFLNGRTVIGYCECTPEAASALAYMENQEVTARWAESFADLLVESAGRPPHAEEVWHLEG